MVFAASLEVLGVSFMDLDFVYLLEIFGNIEGSWLFLKALEAS